MLDDKVKKTLKCMIIGSTIYNVLLFIASLLIFLLFCKNNNLNNSSTFSFIAKNEICVLIGLICSIIGLYSMALSLSKAISSNDANYAKNHVTLMSIVRLLVFCVIFIIVINEKTFGLIGGIMFALATLGVKIGTYMVPIIEKYIS